jgi:hypothetical protein
MLLTFAAAPVYAQEDARIEREAVVEVDEEGLAPQLRTLVAEAEAELAFAEADRIRAEADRIRSEAEAELRRAQAEIIHAEAELVRARAETAMVLIETLGHLATEQGGEVPFGLILEILERILAPIHPSPEGP